MKKWIVISFWIFFTVALCVLMAFANKKQESLVVGLPQIEIEVDDHMLFLTKDIVMQRLRDKGLVNENKTYGENDLNLIENELTNMHEVKSANVYSYVSGEWFIEIKLRQPIARIFNLDGSSCYLDEEGFLMPLSETYTARVLTVSGNINETNLGKNVPEIMNNDSLKTIEILDDLYAISQYVCSDEFFSAQITHVFVNEFNEFELIPRVGDQRILFGNAEHVLGKFKKLEYFYSEGISRAGWDNYDTIDIMFLNAVYCN